MKNVSQITNYSKVYYLQVDKWSKKHKDKQPLSWPILVEQKDYGYQLKYEKQIQLKCNLKSPNNNLSWVSRMLLLLLWLLLLSTLCLITSCPSLMTWPTVKQKIRKKQQSLFSSSCDSFNNTDISPLLTIIKHHYSEAGKWKLGMTVINSIDYSI